MVLENYQMIKLHIYISLFFIFFFFSSLPLISTLQLWLTLKQVEPLWASLVSTLNLHHTHTHTHTHKFNVHVLKNFFYFIFIGELFILCHLISPKYTEVLFLYSITIFSFVSWPWPLDIYDHTYNEWGIIPRKLSLSR